MYYNRFNFNIILVFPIAMPTTESATTIGSGTEQSILHSNPNDQIISIDKNHERKK